MSSWSPIGFEHYRESFPATPVLPALEDITPRFLPLWENFDPGEHRARDSAVTFVLVRGLFGSWIPRHFAAPLATLRSGGRRTIIANTSAVGTMEVNAALLGADVDRRARDGRLVFLCHSKGGLDLLALLEARPTLRDRIAGVVFCQTPRGGCAVLESLLLGRHRDSASPARAFAERAGAVALALARARKACLELTHPAIEAMILRLGAVAASLPLISVASWSSRATAWLDSQHERLAAIRPGCAHDGLFYLEDQLWPGAGHVLLPEIDHAQPSVGGADFDHARFWSALAALAEADQRFPSR